MDKVLGQEYANPQERTAFLRDTIIDEVLERIRMTCPDLVIIEQ